MKYPPIVGTHNRSLHILLLEVLDCCFRKAFAVKVRIHQLLGIQFAAIRHHPACRPERRNRPAIPSQAQFNRLHAIQEWCGDKVRPRKYRPSFSEFAPQSLHRFRQPLPNHQNQQ